MKKKLFILILLAICLTGCSSLKTVNLEESISAVKNQSELIVHEVYYHNVAKMDKKKSKDFFKGLFEKDMELWIEYEGTAELTYDLSKLETTVNGNKISIKLPEVNIINLDIVDESFNEESFISTTDGILNKNKLGSEDTQKAMEEAQEQMKKAIENDANLLKIAEDRAKNMIESSIQLMSGLDSKDYTIEWK